MKNIIFSLAVFSILIGCSSVPPIPKVGENTYAIQIISIGTPSTLENPIELSDLLKHPEARVYEFPITYVEAGEFERNDQTYYVDTPEELVGFDGKYTAPSQETVIRSSEIQIINATKDEVTYLLMVNHWDFKGFAPFKFEDGEELVVAHYDGGQISTEITQPLRDWNIIGGLMTDPEGKETKSSHYFCVRIIPPKNNESMILQATYKETVYGAKYIPSFTINKRGNLSPSEAIILAKDFVRGQPSCTLKVESARVLFNEPREWIVEFYDPTRGDVLPNTRLVSINKITGKAKFQPVI